MSHGIEVKNSSGRTVFNTDEQYPNYYAPGSVSSTPGYTVDPEFSYTGIGKDILLARPQDNESGTLFFSSTDSPTNELFGGHTTVERDFLAANGVKHFYIKPQDFTGTGKITPGSGYGIEVFKDNGTALLFSSNFGQGVEVISYGKLSGNSTALYTNTSYTFNDLYVAMNTFTCTVRKIVAPQGQGIPDYYEVSGAWAYFDDSAGTIRISHAYVLSVVLPPPTITTFSSWPSAEYSAKDYIIFRRLS